MIKELFNAGFAIVPREATAAIVNAGVDPIDDGASVSVIYRVMVEAAQAELIRADEVLALTRG